MSNHRLETRRRARRVRPRVRRILAAALSATVTTIAILGAVGLIPLGGSGAEATRSLAANVADRVSGGPQAPAAPEATRQATPEAVPTPSGDTKVATKGSAVPKVATRSVKKPTAVPEASGSGRRVVFSKSAQRVWLVDAEGVPSATYLVSGSLTNNLSPGRYAVYSRSRWAVGINDSGVMQYFVRFTRGSNAPIGFHSIPKKNGTPLQSLQQLGTPQSHGCIRQKLADAERMWNFAKTGTPVVVVA